MTCLNVLADERGGEICLDLVRFVNRFSGL